MNFVQSKTCERLWAAAKETGRPIPRLSDDPVLDFMVMEAISVKMGRLREEENAKAERKRRRKEGIAELKESLRTRR